MLVGLLIALLSFAFSCKRDPPILPIPPAKFTVIETEPEACSLADSSVFFPRCNSIVGPTIYNLFPMLIDVNYNPNNSNEIAFCRKIYPSDFTLVIYNRTTKVSEVITRTVNVIASNLDWAKDGKIYYNYNYSKIYYYDTKTKTNSLLTHRIGNLTPRVSDSFIYSNGGSPIIGPYIYKCSLEGKIIDSVPGDTYDLSKSGLLAYGVDGNNNISVLSYRDSKKQDEKITNFTDDYNYDVRLGYIAWHPNNEEVYCTKASIIYKANIKTKKIVLVKKFALDRKVLNFDISPDGKKILVCALVCGVKKLNPIDPCEQEQYWQISEMDINGCNEKIVYKEVN